MGRIYDIGWKRETSKGGVLEIINKNDDYFYVECSRCHSDKELFVEPLTVKRQRISEIKTKNPCACSSSYVWSEHQRTVQILRVCEKEGYIFHGFVGKFVGNKTYLDLENPVTGNRWTTCNISNFLNGGKRDPSDKTYLKNIEIPLEVRLKQVENLLDSEGISQQIDLKTLQINYGKMSYTKFVWYCKRGHKCLTSFNNFINHGVRCGTCYKIYNATDQGTKGFADKYYSNHKFRDDYLYILNLKGNGESFYKIGRTFNMTQRMSAIRTKSSYDVTILYVEKGTHFNIYSREKLLLNNTLEYAYVPSKAFAGWTETRCVDSIEDILNK